MFLLAGMEGANGSLDQSWEVLGHLFYLFKLKQIIQLLKVTFHLQLLQNIGTKQSYGYQRGKVGRDKLGVWD